MLIHTIKAFVKRASDYLREAKNAEPGHTQAIRAGHARLFLDDVKLTHNGPSREEIENIGPCIYVANHCSLMDAVLIVAYFEGDLRILAKDSLFKAPWLGRIMKLERHIPVVRGKNASARNAAIRENIKNAIDEKASVLFFPEGTRSATGKPGKFKLGAFYNAIQTGVPIVPIVIRGTFKAMPKTTLKITPGHCSLSILSPIQLPDESAGDESARAQILADQALKAISDELERDPG